MRKVNFTLLIFSFCIMLYATMGIPFNLAGKISAADSIINETTPKKAVTFKDGVWIKKYPDNYACFKFETPSGFKIVADPYNMNEVVKPDIVTESHQHFDHTDTSKLTGKYKLINTIEKYSKNNIKITGFSGRHNQGDTLGTNYIYVFDINGIRIAHFASQGEIPDEKTMDKIGKVDILLLQVISGEDYLNRNTKLTYNECSPIIKKLNPKILIPEHGTFQVAGVLAEYLGKTEEQTDNGSVIITRKYLDAMKDMKVFDLDN